MITTGRSIETSATEQRARAAARLGFEFPDVPPEAADRYRQPVWAATVSGVDIDVMGGGKYRGWALRLPEAVKLTTKLGDDSDQGDVLQSVIICNLQELNLTTHAIPVNSIVFGMLGPPAEDGTPTIWVSWGGGGISDFFLVWGVNDGGTNGSRSTRCTFTYSIFDKPGGTLLGSGLTPHARRSLGYQETYLDEDDPPAGDWMMAYRQDGVKLWDANEVLSTGGCSV